MNIVHMNTSAYQEDNKAISPKEMSAMEFDQIFDKYYKRIYRYICYQINNHSMAEDLCSQVFEKVISKYDTYSPEKASFEVWVFAIARNCVADYHRSNRKGFHLSLDAILDMISPKTSLEEEVITEEVNKELFQALKKLSKKERNIISMKFAAGLKNSEIAGLLGISGANVGVVLHRSLKKLHKLLEIGGYEHG